ncbi:MAG: serine/threonine-protein kinase [Pseudomonadota bacterium]
MLEFPQPAKQYDRVYIEQTDAPLPDKLDPRTRYVLFTTIAKGGKSLIKSCTDRYLGRVVVYKTLKPEFANDPVEQLRLLREARVSAMLQHPNTVPTYEIGRDNRGNYYFTMKLVHGYTLREILNYRERYDLTQLVDVLVQICQALNYAHDHGVVHRDIKPDNILVGPFGEVLLLDWGLAKVWSKAPDGSNEALPEGDATPREDLSITQAGALQGTVVYMSPEQTNKSDDLSGATDIYSIGAILYEVLTGRTPFTGDKVYEVIEQVRTHEPAKPSEVARFKVPELLEEITLQCLRKDPAERIPSMWELIRLLQEDWHRDLQV